MSRSNTGKSFRAAYLINRYLQGSITEGETEELEKWVHKKEQNRQLFEELCSAEAVETQLQQLGNTDTEAAWQWLEQKINSRDSHRQRKISWRTAWRSVAALLVLSVVAWQVLNQGVKKPEHKAALVSQYGGDALPGTKKAELILSDGTAVTLANHTDSIFSESGSTVQRTAGGSLVYTGGSANMETVWNTLHIPNGGEYLIVLEDGSKVWLNAATSLRYPVQFTGKERKVELLGGQAYFEIAENKEKPFIVMTDRMEIQAIGTAFDVNTYTDVDSVVTTTLAEGKVKVKTGSNSNLLLPGEQARVSRSTVIILTTDLDAVTGWKNGLFAFNGTPLKEVMPQVARWYDVSIAYEGQFGESKFFTGEIKRDVPVSKLLEMMELTGIARFRINGNTILVQPYKEQDITGTTNN